MGLDSSVIDRARNLLDTESLRMDELLTQVESEREAARVLRIELEEAQRKIHFEQNRLQQRETKLNARRDREDAEDRAEDRAETDRADRDRNDRDRIDRDRTERNP